MEAYEEAMSLQKIINDPTKTYRKETVDEPIRLGTIDIIRFIKKKINISRKATAAGIAGETLTKGDRKSVV